jgi:hypothetical protein
MITKVHNDSLSQDTFAASLPQRVTCRRESVRLCRKDANLGLDCDPPLNAVGLAGRLQVRENSQRLVNDGEHIDTLQQPLDWANLFLPRGVATGTRRADERFDGVEEGELKMHGFMYKGLGNPEIRISLGRLWY